LKKPITKTGLVEWLKMKAPKFKPQYLKKKKKKKKKDAIKESRAQVVHTCNPSYSGGRHQEDCSSRSAWTNSSQDPISEKKKNHKKGLVEWLKV
jgi:hypothetical protein